MIKAFTYLQFRPRDHWLSSLINNGNTRKISEICSKLTIKATNRCLFQTQEYVIKREKSKQKNNNNKKTKCKNNKSNKQNINYNKKTSEQDKNVCAVQVTVQD